MTDTLHALRALLERRILVLDGAMGTMLQRAKLGDADYRGDRLAAHPRDLKGDPDVLSLTRPDVVRGIHEAYLDGHLMPPGVAKKTWTVDDKGYASLPQGPGLGVEIDEELISKVNADPKRKYKWPTPKQPDGSVTDY